MIEPNESTETTMTMTNRNRDKPNTGHPGKLPTPQTKKGPRSILKGKGSKEKDEETKENEDADETTDQLTLQLDKGDVNADIKSNLGSKFEAATNNKETTDNNHSDDSSNETAKTTKDEEPEADADSERKHIGNKNKHHTGKQDEKEANNNAEHQGIDSENEQDEAEDKDGNEGSEKETEEDEDKTEEQSKFCLDLHYSGYKQHTSEWKGIPEGVMNTSKILTRADNDYMNDLIDNITQEMDINSDKMDKDSWIKTFIKNKDISAARNKRRYIRIFGVSLARSNPAELFSQSIFDGNKLVTTKITMVWAAAYTIYGPGWRRDTIDLGGKTVSPTRLFYQTNKASINEARPFQSENVYSDTPDSLHNLEITMKKICKIKGKGKAAIEPKAWLAAMTKQFDHPTVNKVCLRLAKTPATMFQELGLLDGSELDKIAVTTIWTGAQLLLGQITENTKTTPKATPKPKQTLKKPPETEASAVKFSPRPRLLKSQEIYYLSARPRQNP